MKQSTYTVRDAAKIISRSNDPQVLERLVRQLRYWTTAGIITPQGNKHAGSGKHREYDADEVRKAAITAELMRHGVSAVRLCPFGEYLDSVKESTAWEEAIDGGDNVFFVHAEELEENGGNRSWIGTKSKKDPLWIVEKRPSKGTPKNLIDQINNESWDNYASCLVINLTKLFSNLKL